MAGLALSLDGDALDALAEKLAERVVPRLEAVEQQSPWLTSREAASYLHLSLDGLHRLTAAGAIPHVKQGGRCLFHVRELDDWLRDHYGGPPRGTAT